jgi:hypothetical protein
MFRLTYLPGHNGGPPTGEWADIKSDEHAKVCVEGVKKRRPKSDWFKAATAAEIIAPSTKH